MRTLDSPEVVVGLDLGGTTFKSAFVERDGTHAFVGRHRPERAAGPEGVVAGILDHAAASVAEATRRGAVVRAVGVASCGVVDEAAGVAVFSAAFGWHDVPLRERLAERLGLPVALGHDVRAGGVAEARLGAGVGHDVFLFVPIGTGVGAAVMIGGRPFVGAHWRAGEMGHLVLRPGGRSCGCGQRGCVSTVAGGPAVARRYGELTDDRTHGVDAAGVARLAAAGEPIAGRVWAEMVAALADALAASVSMLDPSAVVLGGGIGRAGASLSRPLREELERRLTFQVMPRLLPARFADESGSLGAGLLAWDLLAGSPGPAPSPA
ncbi:ROK family protein [Streptomyces sp. SID3343]|uniref:ROK family protein n=1 Tax=Streptomyces sp. SID3343 TaxID=2690260 RepID=UPI00136961CA|nr:ROK family protein [Streptomyces sp. SID3343]MYW02309.1 ROK family protein [Streptomyces sp. SID3343]